MIGYIARRLLLGVFTVWAISVLSFVIIQLPEGTTVDRHMDNLVTGGFEGTGTEEERDNLIKYLGLDKPMYVRYSKWMWNLAHGDLGISWRFYGSIYPQEKPVKELIGERIWLTVALTGFTVMVTWTFAIPVGIYSAVRQHSIGDYVFTFIGFSGLAVPDFLLGLVLMYVAFAYFDLSVGGLFSSEYKDASWDLPKINDLLKHLWLPAVVLGTAGTAGLIRIMRNNLLDELSKPYVVTARAKGAHPVRILLKYPVRVSINPLVSTVGYLLPSLVSGSVIVSVVLSLPTLGPVLLDSMIQEDVYTGGFIVLMLGVLTVVGTLVSDILLALVDPRIKFTGR